MPECAPAGEHADMVTVDHRDTGTGAAPAALIDEVVTILAAGRRLPAGLTDRLARTDPLAAEIAAADEVCRTAGVRVADARALLDRTGGDGLLAWWATAVLAERALLDTDLAVVPLAAAVLARMPDDVYAPPAVLCIRGRLRRVASAL